MPYLRQLVDFISDLLLEVVFMLDSLRCLFILNSIPFS